MITPTTVRRVASVFREHWPKAVLLACTGVFSACVGLVSLLLIRKVVDQAIPARDVRLLAELCGAMVGLTLLTGVIDTVQTYYSTRLGQRMMLTLRVRLYERMQQMSLRFFTDTRAGEILSRLTADVAGVQDVVTNTTTEYVNALIHVVSTIALMIVLDWRLALVCLAMFPLIIYPTRRAGELRRKVTTDVQAKVADMAALLGETLSISGALLTKTFGGQRREIERFTTLSQDLMRLETRRAMLLQVFFSIVQVFWAIAPALIYFFGGAGIASRPLTLGSIVAFVALQSRLLMPVTRLLNVQVQVQTSLAFFDRIFQYMDLPLEIGDRPGALALPAARGEVAFERVTFSYPGTSRPALDDVSFTAPPGQLTALVGPSGAGKSTALQLIARLYDPASGSVRLDGHELAALQLESVVHAVGLVSQETYLFHATIRENLRYARPDADDAAIEAAARAAQIHDRIAALPEAYDTMVGERGYKLSGGERQRIAIARVLLKASPVVLLDEATSALDSVSERLVQAALVPLMTGRTTVAIAHRLSTVMSAQQILVFDHGRIVERGTHASLMREGGLYARLVAEQFQTTAALEPAAAEG